MFMKYIFFVLFFSFFFFFCCGFSSLRNHKEIKYRVSAASKKLFSALFPAEGFCLVYFYMQHWVYFVLGLNIIKSKFTKFQSYLLEIKYLQYITRHCLKAKNLQTIQHFSLKLNFYKFVLNQ